MPVALTDKPSSPKLLPSWAVVYARLFLVAILINGVLNSAALSYKSSFAVPWLGWASDIVGILAIWLLVSAL